MLDAYWKAQDSKQTVSPMGGGSDHEPFVYHEGLPGAGAGFGGPFGTYHSAYDDPASLRIFDPGMHRAAAAARYTSMVVLRLADATYPDLRLADLANQLSVRITAFSKARGTDARRSAVTAELAQDAQAFVQAANALDARADAATERGDAAAAATEYTHFRAAEAAFFDGAAKSWQRSLLYSVSGYSSGMLPTLEDTLSSSTGDAALHKLDAAFKAATAAASP
jgi:N-acetylated-alpha-linked acidic dipeptidase